MVATHRTGMWGFIILLAALAFLRSLAPEHTEQAVRGLMKTSNIPNKQIEEEKRQLNEMKDEIKRERIALEKLKEELDQRPGRVEPQHTEEQYVERNTQEGTDSSTPTHIEPNDGSNRESEEKPEEKNIEQSSYTSEGNTAEPAFQQHNIVDAEGKDETETQEMNDSDHDVELVELADDECPVVVAPEYSMSGLGTQIEHVWTSLSVTLAVRNACAVLPPVVTNIGEDEEVEIVPFQEVFDLDELGRTGLRILPLSVCKASGVSHVFDDNGAESAIAKNFVSYVKRSHPSLAEQTTLVHENTQAHRFPPIEETEGDVNRVAAYIASKRAEVQSRECIGFGRMRSAIAFNRDVVEHFKSAPRVDDYASSKYPKMNETLFVKLRWNEAHCNEKRNEDGTVCILSGEILSTDDYVNSIAYAATTVGASKIYISAPPHVPEDVSAQISSKLRPVDPVVLDVGSDFFTASVIEREMALRSRAFVADGGAWGESVQEARRMHYPHLFKEGYNSLLMVEEWRNAGSPTELPIIMASHVQEDYMENETSNPGASAGDQSPATDTSLNYDQQAEAPDTSSSETGGPDLGSVNAKPLQPEPEQDSVEIGAASDPGSANAMPRQQESEPVNEGTEITPNLEGGDVAPAQPEGGYVNEGAEVMQGTTPETQPPEGLPTQSRPEAYEPPQTYSASQETDHHLFPDGQIPERKFVDQPPVVAEGGGQAAYIPQNGPNSDVVRIVSGDGGDNAPHQGGEGEQSP